MGSLFKIPGYIVYGVGGLWGFLTCLSIVFNTLGFIGGVLALMFLPFTLAIAPWYAIIKEGNWFPLILVYGSGLVGTILLAIGYAIDRE